MCWRLSLWLKAALHKLCANAAQDEQPVAALVALTQRLEGARFRDFWLAQDACRDVVAGVAGFYEAACPQPLG